MSTPRRSRLAVAIAASLAIAVIIIGVPTAVAASQVTECGQYQVYTAPDPAGPTDGSLQLGQLSAWTIGADATITPPADTLLPGLLSGQVLCLDIDLDDDGVITALALAPEGTIDGLVTFDSGTDAYLFHDRVVLPTAVTDLTPGLKALFDTSADAGTNLRVTFFVDTTTGNLAAIAGIAEFCGLVDVDDDGNGVVGAATIDADVLDAADIEALAGAGSRNTCATIETSGTLDSGTGELTLTTEVTIEVAAAPTAEPTAAPTAPPTSTRSSHPTSTPTDGTGWVVLILVFAASLAIATRRRGTTGL